MTGPAQGNQPDINRCVFNIDSARPETMSACVLLSGCCAGRLDEVRQGLSQGVSPDATDGQGIPAIAFAVARGHTAVVELLVDAGADVNRAFPDGSMSPLRAATVNGRTEIARILLNNGAEVDHQDADGHTPLTVAALKGQVEIARMLMEKGANVHLSDGSFTPLMYAVMKGQAEIARMLMEKGANALSGDGTPLTHTQIVEMLQKAAPPRQQQPAQQPASPHRQANTASSANAPSRTAWWKFWSR